jgi:type VI secretion system secreted protein VgrG
MNDQFTLTLPDFPGAPEVTSLTGQEAMSALYHFDVHVLLAAEDGFVSQSLETPATLTLSFDDAPARAVQGIVSSCEATGLDERGVPSFVLQIVPRLARLEKRSTSRIFQDQTTREIVEYVIALFSIPNRWQLTRQLPKRAYCVQYDETDYAFITRMLASEGIFFYFDHPTAEGAEETLVLSDSVQGYAPIDGSPTLQYRPLGAAGSALTVAEDQIQAFGLRRAMRSKRVLLRRFEFQRPPIPHVDAAARDGARQTGDLDSMRAFVDTGTTVYEHQQTREDALVDPIPARIALEAETADAALAEGETACRRLLPGRTFQLLDATLPELDGSYVVVSTSHEGYTPTRAAAGQQVFTSRFTAVPAAVPFRPPYPRRVVRQTFETATVVGPVDQEIFTDEFGRIKVQFHWDLQGKFTDKSSTWLRVVQPWAGFGYGVQFLPRIGHEVVVGYIDGDADRPMVFGSVHNGVNPTPYTFPRDRAMSGIKTWSTPSGAGGHELLFDDSAGSELVALRSVRRMQVGAVSDATADVGDDLAVTVGGDRSDAVTGDASTRIGGDELCETGGDRTTMIGGDASLDVRGTSVSHVARDESQTVDGVRTLVVGKARVTAVGTMPEEPAHDMLSVTGRYEVASGREMRLSSQRRVQLVCGDSMITLTPDEIVIESPVIQLQAKKRIALLQGDPPEATLTLAGSAAIGGGTVTAVAGGRDGVAAKLLLDVDAHLDGALVKLNCGFKAGAGGTIARSDDATGAVRFTIARDDLPPGAMVTLFISTPTGEVVERPCPVGGSVTMEGKTGDVFTVVDMRVDGTSVPVSGKNTPA